MAGNADRAIEPGQMTRDYVIASYNKESYLQLECHPSYTQFFPWAKTKAEGDGVKGWEYESTINPHTGKLSQNPPIRHWHLVGNPYHWRHQIISEVNIPTRMLGKTLKKHRVWSWNFDTNSASPTTSISQVENRNLKYIHTRLSPLKLIPLYLFNTVFWHDQYYLQIIFIFLLSLLLIPTTQHHTSRHLFFSYDQHPFLQPPLSGPPHHPLHFHDPRTCSPIHLGWKFRLQLGHLRLNVNSLGDTGKGSCSLVLRRKENSPFTFNFKGSISEIIKLVLSNGIINVGW